MTKEIANQLSAILKPLGYKRVGSVFRKNKGPVTEAVGVQKNRFDRTFRLNVMILLTDPFEVHDEQVILYAHLQPDGVHFGAANKIWWKEEETSDVKHLLGSAVVPWLESHNDLKFLRSLFLEALRSGRGEGEILGDGKFTIRYAAFVYLEYLTYLAVHLGDLAAAKQFCEEWLLIQPHSEDPHRARKAIDGAVSPSSSLSPS